jgi:hypothetical protein
LKPIFWAGRRGDDIIGDFLFGQIQGEDENHTILVALFRVANYGSPVWTRLLPIGGFRNVPKLHQAYLESLYKAANNLLDLRNSLRFKKASAMESFTYLFSLEASNINQGEITILADWLFQTPQEVKTLANAVGRGDLGCVKSILGDYLLVHLKHN